MPLSDYQLIRQLSAGEDGTRYLATCADRTLEVRCLKSDLGPRTRAAWKQRIRTCDLVTHECAWRIMDADLDDESPYFVLPSSAQLTPLTAETRDKLSAVQALRLARDMTQVVADCHRVGLSLGGLLDERIVRFNNSWHLDVSGLRCSGATPYQPPTPSDPSRDIVKVGRFLNWLIFRAAPDDDGSDVGMATMEETDKTRIALTEPIGKLIRDCISKDAGERPTAVEAERVLTRWISLSDGEQTMGSGSDLTMDQTGADDVQMAPTTGQERATMPETLGRYRIANKLGEGGMGAVYRGEDVSSGKEVAIKVLAAQTNVSSKQQRRFFKEARILAQVNNPFITNLLEFNEDQGENFIVLEFVRGKSLDDVLQDHGPVSEAAAVRILSDVARALLDAHHRGIVHRDIKPGNVLLIDNESGTKWLAANRAPTDEVCVKLSDFGLARNEDQSESLAITQAGALIGTPHYMAPEQCRGEAVDTRTDIYQMGATLFHLLAGKPPFDAETPVGLIAKHVSEPPPSLRKLRPDLSEAIIHIVEKSLAKDPPARYQKSGDILDDLEALAHGNPTTLQIHPHLPNTNTDEVQTFEFEWDLQSSPGVLWPHVVNTDRLNQAMGLPPAQFRVERDPELGNRRFAETKIMGLKIAWEEHPFEWIEGRRMGVLRQFSHGPFLWFCSIVEMQPLGAGGTKLRHIVHLEPRNVMGRWIGKREAGTKAQKSLNRIYRQIDDYEAAAQKSNPAADPFGKVHEATARQRTAIAARMSRLRAQALSPDILDTLEQFLGHASDQELARIRPGAFADRFGLDLNDVLEVCFQAVQQGLLVLLWDVMCPTCRIPSDVKETLQSLGEHGNCEACNIDFELDFGNSVELIFRAHSEVRPVEIRTYCIGGPAFSAHVVAQIRVAPQERFVCELQLAAGAYKLRGPQLPYAIDFRVNSQGELSRWEVDLCGHPEADDIELKTGAQTVILRNDGDVELLIRIERIASKQDAVTAADASAVSLFRELFPDQILSPGQMVSVETITMLMVELMSADKLYQELGDSAAFTKIHQALRFFDDTIRRYHGAVVKSIGEGITAVFPRAVDAAAAAVALVEKRHEALPAGSDLPRAAIHRGTAMVTTIDDRLDYFGSTVKITEQLLRAARAGQIVCSGEVAGSAELDQVLRAQATRAMLVDREPLFEYPRVFPHRWTLT